MRVPDDRYAGDHLYSAGVLEYDVCDCAGLARAVTLRVLEGQAERHRRSFGSVHSTYGREFPRTLSICLAFFNDDILASINNHSL